MGPVTSRSRTWLLPPAPDDSGHLDTHVDPGTATVRKRIRSRAGAREAVEGGGVRKNPNQANMYPVAIRQFDGTGNCDRPENNSRNPSRVSCL